MKSFFYLIACLCGGMLFTSASLAQPDSVFLEDFTWPEIADQIKGGTNQIIIASGGTEQNGPHLTIGKHNWIVRYTAQHIAQQLGHTLVAPIIAYVPEGPIDATDGHMHFAGTISLRDNTFAALLEDTARSLKQHGFTHIYLIGDHGDSQPVQQKVADTLTREWRDQGIQIIHISDYYASKAAQSWAQAAPLTIKDPAEHAGFMDTSELLVAHKTGVRKSLISQQTANNFAQSGVKGDPSYASEAYGKKLLEFKINAAIEQIRRSNTP